MYERIFVTKIVIPGAIVEVHKAILVLIEAAIGLEVTIQIVHQVLLTQVVRPPVYRVLQVITRVLVGVHAVQFLAASIVDNLLQVVNNKANQLVNTKLDQAPVNLCGVLQEHVLKVTTIVKLAREVIGVQEEVTTVKLVNLIMPSNPQLGD